MVENVNVNVGTPEALEFARGLVDGVGDAFDEFIENMKEGSNEVFMTMTISVMVVVGFVYVWRRI